MAIKWAVTRTEEGIIKAIVDRALEIRQKCNPHAPRGHGDKLSLEMVITAVHANGCPLRLAALLEAHQADFVHDVFGMERHLNKATGRLEDHFLPRYARPSEV